MAPAAPIEFVEQAEGPGEQAIATDVDKAKQRAEKYGLPLDVKKIERTPGMLRDASRKQAALQKANGNITSFDMFEDAEVERQQQRSARFGTAPPQTQIEVAQPSEEEEARKARAAKYGMEYQEPDPSGVDGEIVLEERREAAPESALRPEALHVYGVDLVATRDLLTFFSAYGPTFVEWIDDSSCNVLFPDEFTVKRVLVQMGEAISNEEAASMAGIKPQDEAAERLWYRAKTALTKQGVAVPLLFRIAFTSDAKNWMKQHKTRRLWQLPVRQAVAVAQGKAELPEAPQQHKAKRKSGQKAKRDGPQEDADGDAVMDEQQPRGRGGKKRHKLRSEADFADDAPPRTGGGGNTFLADNDREAGAHSFFLNDADRGADNADAALDAEDNADVAAPAVVAPKDASHAVEGNLVDLREAAEGARQQRAELQADSAQQEDGDASQEDMMEVE